MADVLIKTLGLAHIRERSCEDPERRYLHIYKPRRPASEEGKHTNTLIFNFLTPGRRGNISVIQTTQPRAIYDRPSKQTTPILLVLQAHPFYDPYHIITHFCSYELLDWSYLPGCEQHKDQNHVSLKFSAQRELLCWFNNKARELFRISPTTR